MLDLLKSGTGSWLRTRVWASVNVNLTAGLPGLAHGPARAVSGSDITYIVRQMFVYYTPTSYAYICRRHCSDSCHCQWPASSMDPHLRSACTKLVYL